MPIVPAYITTYISSLRKLSLTNPTVLYERYGFQENKRPGLNFEAVFDTNVGWRVEHKDDITNQLYFSEIIQPPKTQQPERVANPQFAVPAVPTTPTESISNNVFTLMVDNVGLPRGVAASTKILVVDKDNTIISTIDVPFSSRLDLPIYKDGFSLSYIFKTSVVSTGVSEFASSLPSPIIPTQNTVITQKIEWTDRFLVNEVEPIRKTIPTKKAPEFFTTTSDAIKPLIKLAVEPPREVPLPLPLPKYSVNLLQPPANSFEASSVDEMISFAVSRESNMVYEIGSQNLPTPITYRIRNNTVSHVLKIKFIYPDFLSIDVINPIIIDPQRDILVTFSLNTIDAQNKSILKQKTFSSNIQWSVEPLNVMGPVYIKRNLPPVTV